MTNKCTARSIAYRIRNGIKPVPMFTPLDYDPKAVVISCSQVYAGNQKP